LKNKDVEEILREKAKTIDEFEEKARQLNDELCWGNRKDIGIKFPRTPLTQEEYNAKAKEYHEEKWVKLSDVEAQCVGRAQLKKLQDDFPKVEESIHFTDCHGRHHFSYNKTDVDKWRKRLEKLEK